MAQFTVTIDHTKVDSSLTDFPVFINLADLPAGFWSTVANGGGDIRVYASDGTTELAREVVTCDTATDTGELHIKVPSVSSSVDTVMKIDVDGVRSDYAVTATYGSQNVWSNNYVAVWHLGEDPTGLAPQMKDSTANGNNGTVVGTMISSDSIVGTIGQGLRFDGSNAVNIPDSTTIHPTPSITVSSYMSFASLADNTRVISDWHQDKGSDRWIFYLNGGSIGFYLDASKAGRTAPTLNQIYRFDGTYNKTDSELSWYVDGVLDQVLSKTYTMVDGTHQEIRLGKQEESGNGLDGTMDETRISSVARKSEWILTEYNNQSSPSTFYTVTTPIGGNTTNFFRFF